MEFMKRTTQFLTVVLLMCAGSAYGLSADLIGHRLEPDSFVPGSSSAFNKAYQSSIKSGGRLHVYFRNTSGSSIKVSDIRINGTPFAYLPDEKRGDFFDHTTWWMGWPETVPNGETGAIWMRLKDIAATLGSGNITFTLVCNAGNIDFTFDPEPSDLWIPFVGFMKNQRGFVVFVGNRGDSAITLPSGGGLELNGQAVSGTLPTTTIQPGDTVPIEISTSYYSKGTPMIFKVTSQDGQHMAAGHQRIFPAQFGVTCWFDDNGWDERDATNHFIDLEMNGIDRFKDEPTGHREDPRDPFATDILDAWDSDPTEVRMIQLTEYEENLIFSGMADAHMSHRGPKEQDCALQMSWPNPVWYLPQNAWARGETWMARENWYPLEDMRFQAFRAVGQGAKNIQWFSYVNLWEQGYGRGGGADLGRTHQDDMMMGAGGNPVIWERIGRVSGTLQLLRDYWDVSAPAYRDVDDHRIEINSVLLDDNKLISVLADSRTPFTKMDQAVGTDEWPQQILYNYPVSIRKPSFVEPTRALLIDPYKGVQSLTIAANNSTNVVVVVPEIDTAAIILLGDSSDESALQAAWANMQDKFSDVDNLKATLLARTSSATSRKWLAPDRHYRVRVAVTNIAGWSASVLGLPMDLPLNRTISSNSVRVFEVTPTSTNEVSFFYEPEQSVENFEGNVISRVSGSPNPPAGYYQFTQSNGALHVNAPITSRNRKNIYLDFSSPSWGKGRWISSEFKGVRIDGRFGTFSGAKNIMTILDFDKDGNGSVDGSVTLYYLAEILERNGADGWTEYMIDVEEQFAERYPGEEFRGQWKLRYLTALYANSFVDEQYSFREITACCADTVRVRPSGGTLPARQSRWYEVYFDVAENGPHSRSGYWDESLRGASVFADATSHALPIERAGTVVMASPGSAALQFSTSVSVSNLYVRHLATNGAFVAERMLSPSGSRSFSTTMPRALLEGETVAVVPVEASHEGGVFLYDASGIPVGAHTPNVNQEWARTFDDESYSIDMTKDGNIIAVAHGNVLSLYDKGGTNFWQTSYEGRTAFVEFSPDEQWLYVAANRSSDHFNSSNWKIMKIPATGGSEIWSSTAGSGVVAYPGRTILDMKVFPDGGVGYAEWNGYCVRLSQGGNRIWSRNVGFYANGLSPRTNGAAVLGPFDARLVDEYGNSQATADFGGAGNAVGAAENGGLWAAAGNTLMVYSNSTKLAEHYIGRYVRKIEVSSNGTYLAAGTADGVFALLDGQGNLLWQKEKNNSYISDIELLPDGSGVAFAREVFDYSQPHQWRFRDVIEAYYWNGEQRWHQEGPWHDQPFMSQFSLNSNGTYMAVLSDGHVRYVNAEIRVTAPSISPSGGSFTDPVTISMQTPTEWAEIFYTTDGSVPDANSTLYTGPFAITNSATIRAVAGDSNRLSEVSSEVFTRKIAPPYISPPGTSFLDHVDVTIFVDPNDADVYYTLDGTTPSESSIPYSGPFSISSTVVMKAKGFGTGYGASEVTTANFLLVTNSRFRCQQDAFIFEVNAGATESQSLVISNAGAANLTFMIEDLGFNYEWKSSEDVGGPAYNWVDISPTGATAGVQAGLINVWGMIQTDPIGLPFEFPFYGTGYTQFMISVNGAISFDADPIIDRINQPIPFWYFMGPETLIAPFWDHYNDADNTSVFYRATADSLTVAWLDVKHESGKTNTFQAVLHDDGRIQFAYQKVETSVDGATAGLQASGEGPSLGVSYNQSGVIQEGALLDFTPPIEWLTIVPDSGSIASMNALSVQVQVDASLLTNGVYETTLRITHNDSTSPAKEIPVTLVVGDALRAPEVSPTGGVYQIAPYVELSNPNAVGTVRYSLDGSMPTEASPVYDVPFFIDESATLMAKCFQSGYLSSPLVYEEYDLESPLPAPDIIPDGGTFTNQVTIVLDVDSEETDVRYTLDGTTPTTGSLEYNSPFTLTNSATLKARSLQIGVPLSGTSTADYVIVYRVQPPAMSPSPGNYERSVVVTMQTVEVDAQIYYTDDGSTPTTADQLYTGAIALTNNATLKAVAVRDGRIDSMVTSGDYVITPPLAPSLDLTYRQSVTVDGNLSEWDNARWTLLTNVYYGIPSDLPQPAMWAGHWNSNGVLYAAVKVYDNEINLRSSWGGWNLQDDFELYVHGLPGTSPQDYYDTQSSAQQYFLGLSDNESDAWVYNPQGVTAPVTVAAQRNGNLLTYECAIQAYDLYGSTPSAFELGDMVGFDVIVGTRMNSGSFAMTSHNNLRGKFDDTEQIAQHELKMPSYYLWSIGYGRGTVTPAGRIEISHGQSTNLQFSAWPYASISNVWVNGSSVGAPSSYMYGPALANGTVTVAFADAMAAQNTPQWWLVQHGWSSEFDAAATNDSDGDNIPTWMEYIADTQPTNANSYFRIRDLLAGDLPGIQFESSTNRFYTMEFIDNLMTGQWHSVPGMEMLDGEGGMHTIHDPSGAGKARIYRLNVYRP